MSSTATPTFARFSSEIEPLARMPFREAPPIPPKKERGTEMTSAQGQETTRNISAWWTQGPKGSRRMSGGRKASSAAPMTTAGV